MRILITGSEGLIGSALRVALSSLNIEVVGFDIRHDIDHEEHGDILDLKRLYSATQKVDGIVHLAAVSRVIFGEKNPKLCWETNVVGTKNVIEAAMSCAKKPWVLYASSREVYGQQEKLPVKETARLIPVNIYGESKIAAESAIHKAVTRGLKGYIVRFSNVFGSIKDHHDRVVPAFCLAAASGLDLRVDGRKNLFDFTYIEDVVQGVLAYVFVIMKNVGPLPPIHFTTGVASSLGQIAEFAKQSSSYNIQIREKSSRSFDVATFCGDTSRAKKILNWSAAVNVQEGMNRLINQFRLYFESDKQAPAKKHEEKILQML